MKTFLTAEWRALAIANYAIDPTILQEFLPYKTELDLWNSTCYVSLVAFKFCNTKIKGIRIPFYSNFEEVNLRFYVRSNGSGPIKRGVVFIKEIASKRMIAFIAQKVYSENYITLPTRHSRSIDSNSFCTKYEWGKGWSNVFQIDADKHSVEIDKGSEEEFILEHYWGYSRRDPVSTLEYPVEHLKWKIHPVQKYQISVDFDELYGPKFSHLSNITPKSVFLCEGSEISIKNPTRI